MEFEQGQILVIPMTLENSPRRNRHFLIQSVHEILPVLIGYRLESIGTGGARRMQAVTNIPLIPCTESNLLRPAVACMDTEYVLDRSTALHIVGHLRKPEQEIMDDYDALLRGQGLVRKADLADLDQKLADQYTILQAVAANEAMTVSRLLHRYDGQDDCLSKLPLLHCAARHESVESAKVIFQYGAWPDALDKTAKMPLWYAVEGNNPKMAQLLLDNRANMNLRVGGRSIREIVRSVKMQKILDGQVQKLAQAGGRSL